VPAERQFLCHPAVSDNFLSTPFPVTVLAALTRMTSLLRRCDDKSATRRFFAVVSNTPLKSYQIRTQITQKQEFAQIDFCLICVDLRSISVICVNSAAGSRWKTNV